MRLEPAGARPWRGRAALRTLLAACVAFCASALASTLHPPVPIAHDEFAYLLAADTFARGRLANPTPAGWEALETMHVLMVPAYGAKYPPGQGLALALGLLLGAPILGAWLSSALAAGAVAWMLDAWLRRPWASVGAFLFALHPVVALGWGATYWGGALAVAGAALAWGAVPRLVLRGTSGLALGAGVGLCAITRPFESLVALLPLAWLLTRAVLGAERPPSAPARSVLLRACASAALSFAPFVALILAHDRAATGNALRLPYQEHFAQYEVVPVWVFGGKRAEPEYRHELLRTFYARSSAREHDERRTVEGLLAGLGAKLDEYGGGFVGPLWACVLLGLFLRRRDGRLALPLAGVALGAAALAAETFEHSHYAAPFLPAGLVVLCAGAERIWHAPRARSLLRPALVLLLVAGWLPLAARAEARAQRRESHALARRGELERELAAAGGPQLVFLRYGVAHNPHLEWVFNGAQPDEQAVLWARSRGEELDRAFAALYPGRRAWLLDPDLEPLAPEPYLRE